MAVRGIQQAEERGEVKLTSCFLAWARLWWSSPQALEQGLGHLGSQFSPLLPPSVGNFGPLGAGNSRAGTAAPRPPSTGGLCRTGHWRMKVSFKGEVLS